LLLTAHFGNWELLPIVGHICTTSRFASSTARWTPRFSTAFSKRAVPGYGGQPIPTRRGAMRQIYKTLRSKATQWPCSWTRMWIGMRVFLSDFFNHRACTNTGMALLALKSGAPVLPLFLIRAKATGFMRSWDLNWTTIRTGDARKDVELNTQMYNRVIEIYASDDFRISGSGFISAGKPAPIHHGHENKVHQRVNDWPIDK
jgi:KDO2-lipid IV(A) lauroyltransferase